jgi:hypothetical protein
MPYRPDPIQSRADLVVEMYRRMHEEGAIGESDHRHPGADLRTEESLRRFSRPDAGIDFAQHRFTSRYFRD